jgi:hypothetical protein
MTHNELIKIAENWLYKSCGCGAVITELVTSAKETPDAFGLRCDYTVLVECKISRSDFLADQKKMFRLMPDKGIGDYRFYLCENDLIKPDELPQAWGLIYWNGKKVKQIKGPKGNIWSLSPEYLNQKSAEKEYRLIYSALRRMYERN